MQEDQAIPSRQKSGIGNGMARHEKCPVTIHRRRARVQQESMVAVPAESITPVASVGFITDT
jgi:hypothetical protein